MYNVTCSNINAAVRYVKIYNKATAPVLATDIPILIIPIPANSTISLNLGSLGFRCSAGIAMSITTGAADTDTGVVAAGEIKTLISYI